MDNSLNNTFDVIVVGGGHAGVEAAYAAAKMGSKTLLLTLDYDKIASMPCNPSVGGLGKGHMVFEISALGGLMPQLCSKTYLQARMLNTSKGPAVQGLRLQIDKYAYSKLAKEVLLNCENLTILKHMTVGVLTEIPEITPDITPDIQDNRKRITGVITAEGLIFNAPCVVVTTGTFLNGLIHVGRTRYRAGRRGEEASMGLSESIAQAMGVNISRLKTGTPPRILRTSIDFSQLEKQENLPLEYLFEFDPVEVTEKIPCYIAHTNEKTHKIISDNLHLSALYSGNIKGQGPRYCPSIEDKVGRYPDRTSHHVFIEPEGQDIDEIYPAGISTSLPLEVQLDYIRSMKGFENAVIAKCGYAIEYDAIQPNNLTHTLEAKTVSGLFLAGQLNGTTGYEEAASQGLIAGINAHLKQASKPPFILNRNESYIGVMIDDLVTLGADEPYRMFTSRAERRLLLRQDNVFMRLTPYAYNLGLISQELYEKFLQEKTVIEQAVQIIRDHGHHHELFKTFNSIEFTPEVQAQAREIITQKLLEKSAQNSSPSLDSSPSPRGMRSIVSRGIPIEALSGRALLCIYAETRYEGYIAKEKNEVEKAAKYQSMEFAHDINFLEMPGLSKELQHKLSFYKPKTIAQAQLIPGMTPAAISVLIFQTRAREKQ